MTQPKVSVYIPIYNVEKYIERCARSLFGQTLDEMEFIFVNDCTPDKSVEILKATLNEFPNRIPQTTILHHEKNKGIAATRTTGILACKGQYIIACDSDDWVELDMYEKMFQKAISTDSDVVQCNFYHEMGNERKIEEYDEILNVPSFLNSKKDIWITTWNKLIKRDLYIKHKILPYPNINMYEDVGFIVRLLCLSSKISTIHEPLYHYNRTNTNSILHEPDKKEQRLVDRIHCIDKLEYFFYNNNVKADKYILNEKESIIKSCIDNKLYNYLRGYPELIKHFIIERKDLSLLYRFLIGLSFLGFISPLKIYIKIRT